MLVEFLLLVVMVTMFCADGGDAVAGVDVAVGDDGIFLLLLLVMLVVMFLLLSRVGVIFSW